MAMLSIILPTLGRSTLAAALDSLVPQLTPADELVVVADGCTPVARDLTRAARDQAPDPRCVSYSEILNESSGYGNAQRDLAIRLARGTHLCFLDDDDVYEPDALGLFREAADLAPHAVHVFRARWGPGHHARGVELWADRAFVESNIATPMVLMPKRADLPLWMSSNDRGTTSDFGWMQAAVGMQRVVWHTERVATIRPAAR